MCMFDFEEVRTVQIGKDLYAVRERDLGMMRFKGLDNCLTATKEELATYNKERFFASYSASVLSEIFVTGGWNRTEQSQ